jgi:uncharacterized protein
MNNKLPGRIIDSHIHIFPEKMMEAVFHFFSKVYGWKLPFKTNPDQLVKDLLDQGVEKAFTLAYTHKPGMSRKLNQWLAQYCENNPWLYPFGAIHPEDPDFAKVLVECLDHYKFPGMKLHCLVQQHRPDDRRLFPLYEALIERSKGVIIHAGNFPQPSEKHLGVKYVTNLLHQFPNLNLIIPHLGLNDLPAYMKLLQTYDGLYLDTAFVFQNKNIFTPLDEIKKVILSYPDRILYGSDFPFILEPPRNGISRILQLALPRKILPGLFYQNALDFLARIR